MWELIRKDIREHGKAVAFMAAMLVVLVKAFGAACISQLMVGLPCPACGMSRAALLFLSGHWKESLQMQPLFAALLAGAVLLIVFRYFLKRDTAWMKYYAVIILTAAMVFYVYRMVCYFPDIPPMTYRKENLLSYVLQICRNLWGN